MAKLFNQHLLLSGVDYFDDQAAINPFMDASVGIDIEKASNEHANIVAALQQAGIKTEIVAPPVDCQDGVYTANWALVRNNLAIMANLPNAREAEMPYAEAVLQNLGIRTIKLPSHIHFSGQGDALPCGDWLFMGTGYRTDQAAHKMVAEQLGYKIVSLQTIPLLNAAGQPVINPYSGWADSFFYDLDLALSILKLPDPITGENGLIAWCPEAFTPISRDTLRAFNYVDKIEVSLAEAKEAYACNLVSTGETVIMSSRAPELKAAIESHGLKTITPEISELAKGGGYIRCTSVALDNQ